MKEKSISTDLTILEQLPPVVDLLFLADRFNHYKNPRKKVFDLTRKGYLELVRNGHYLNLKSQNFKQVPLEKIANALYFPSYISAEWALQYYGLLTERVYTITSVTPRKSINFKTSLGNFEFNHLHKHRYAFGYEVLENDFMIARPEKALIDYLNLRGHFKHWTSCQDLEEFLTEDLRIHFSSFLDQITADHLQEILPHYHRNSKEARTLKWILTRKELSNAESN